MRSFVHLLTSVSPYRTGLALTLIVGVSATEWVGLLLLIPLLGLAGLDVDQGAVGRISELMASAFGAAGLRPTLATVLGLYIVLVAARALLKRAQILAIVGCEQRVVLHLRRRLYRAITHARWLFLSRTRGPEFMSALTGHAARAAQGARSLLALAAHLLLGAVYFLLALKVSASMTLLAGGCGLLLLLGVRKGNQRAREAGARMTRRTDSLYTAVAEHLGGMKTAKSYGAERRNVEMFDHLSDEVAQVQLETARNHASVRAWFEVGSVLLLSMILYVALGWLALSTAEVLLLLFLFTRLVPRFSHLQETYQYLVNALPAFTTVMDLILECEAEGEQRGEGPVPNAILRHGITLEEVSFTYRTESETRTIADLTLFIPARRTSALVGPSGAGKSTVADLVMGLLVPDRGRVLVDEVPLGRGSYHAWRERIGYVAQETVLFHDTVRANLLWARPSATEAEIWHALALAAAQHFVRALPHSLDTVVGDRGVLLSGGERQRLALARALLRKPTVLILDEATSALDAENERQVLAAVDNLHGEVAVLVITHRLSAIRGADLIYVLEEGRLVESGGWEELTRSEGRFADFCWAQQLPVWGRTQGEALAGAGSRP